MQHVLAAIASFSRRELEQARGTTLGPAQCQKTYLLGPACGLAVLPTGAFDFLREVCMGMASCESTLKYLGFKEMPNKPIECRGVPSLRIFVR
jgi:hypothetical protein